MVEGTESVADPIAEVIADSEHCVAKFGRLTTMRLKVPTCVLAQFNTHRAFSRNAASMRAIPTARLLKAVWSDPYFPPELGRNRAGMQAGDELTPGRAKVVTVVLHAASIFAICVAWLLNRLGGHKQWVNRILAPFSFTQVVATGNDRAWRHFFALRNHPHADPAIRVVAEAAQAVYSKSKPVRLAAGEWHLPYVNLRDYSGAGWLLKAIKQSVARCARVSYSTFGSPTPSSLEADLDLYQKLLGGVYGSSPPHASPAEHQACAVLSGDQGGNFGPGWMQHRKTLVGEYTA